MTGNTALAYPDDADRRRYTRDWKGRPYSSDYMDAIDIRAPHWRGLHRRLADLTNGACEMESDPAAALFEPPAEDPGGYVLTHLPRGHRFAVPMYVRRGTELHHLTYARLKREDIGDVLLLCRHHHQQVDQAKRCNHALRAWLNGQDGGDRWDAYRGRDIPPRRLAEFCVTYHRNAGGGMGPLVLDAAALGWTGDAMDLAVGLVDAIVESRVKSGEPYDAASIAASKAAERAFPGLPWFRFRRSWDVAQAEVTAEWQAGGAVGPAPVLPVPELFPAAGYIRWALENRRDWPQEGAS